MYLSSDRENTDVIDIGRKSLGCTDEYYASNN